MRISSKMNENIKTNEITSKEKSATRVLLTSHIVEKDVEAQAKSLMDQVSKMNKFEFIVGQLEKGEVEGKLHWHFTIKFNKDIRVYLQLNKIFGACKIYAGTKRDDRYAVGYVTKPNRISGPFWHGNITKEYINKTMAWWATYAKDKADSKVKQKPEKDLEGTALDWALQKIAREDALTKLINSVDTNLVERKKFNHKVYHDWCLMHDMRVERWFKFNKDNDLDMSYEDYCINFEDIKK